ncbi:MAG: prepilin-type N-terminal cleavage/methylation domain-containing protein [bacterium]
MRIAGDARKIRQGFTLIELLIVVAIIGILAAIAVPNFLNAQVRSKVAKAESEMNSFVTACEMYRIDHGQYFPHAGYPNSVIHAPWQNKYLTTPVAYFSAQPRDPFQDIAVQDANSWNLTFGMYHLENIFMKDGSYYAGGAMDPNLRVPNNPADVARAFANRPHSYELWSVGPNNKLDYNVSGSGITGFIYYRASNGVQSLGDIVWIRP